MANVWEILLRLRIARHQNVQVFPFVNEITSFISAIILNLVTASEWQQWGDWSQCTASCGEGIRQRARACSGLDGQCQGDFTKDEVCKIEECPGTLI